MRGKLTVMLVLSVFALTGCGAIDGFPPHDDSGMPVNSTGAKSWAGGFVIITGSADQLGALNDQLMEADVLSERPLLIHRAPLVNWGDGVAIMAQYRLYDGASVDTLRKALDEIVPGELNIRIPSVIEHRGDPTAPDPWKGRPPLLESQQSEYNDWG